MSARGVKELFIVTLNNKVRLELNQRCEAEKLATEVELEPLTAAFEIIALRRIAHLAAEFCTAVDRAANDIGGSRTGKEILAELGPALDAARVRFFDQIRDVQYDSPPRQSLDYE